MLLYFSLIHCYTHTKHTQMINIFFSSLELKMLLYIKLSIMMLQLYEINRCYLILVLAEHNILDCLIPLSVDYIV